MQLIAINNLPCTFMNIKMLTQYKVLALALVFFFCYQQFFNFIFSHTTQHNIQNTTKQNNRHILNISRSNQKGGREGRTTRTQKLLLYIITYIQQKTLPSINGRRPGSTNSRRRLMTTGHSQNICRKVPDDVVLHTVYGSSNLTAVSF